MIGKIQFGDPPLDNHFFEINLALLKNHLSKPIDLKNQLPEKITIIHANSGQPTAKYNGILLHSKYDPNKEGIGWPTYLIVRDPDDNFRILGEVKGGMSKGDFRTKLTEILACN